MNDTSPREILKYVTWVVFKHKLSIAVILAFTVLCFGAGTFMVTPQWEATARLMVMQDPKQQMILFGDLQAPINSDNRASAMDLVEILTGNELAQKVVDEFKLDERMRRKAKEPRIMSEKAKYWLVQGLKSPITLMEHMGWREPAEANWYEKAIDELLEDMEDIQLVEETSTIHLTIWADDPQLAVDICNYMVDYLLEKTRDFERSEAVATYEFVTEQLSKVEAALQQAEDDLFRFKEENGIVELEREREILLSRLDALSTQSGLQHARLAALNAKLAELESQLGGPARAGTPDNAATGSTAKPTGDIATVSRPYSSYRNAINEREKEQEILEARVQVTEVKGESESLQADIASIQAQLDEFNRLELESERLVRSSVGLRERYLNLRSKQLALEVQKYTENSQFDIKVADAAYVPPGAEKDWPKWGVNLMAGLLCGLAFAFGQAFLFEYWRDALRDADEVTDVCGIPVLGSVRSVSVKAVSRRLQKNAVTPQREDAARQTADKSLSEETLPVDLAPTSVVRSKRELAEALSGSHSENL